MISTAYNFLVQVQNTGKTEALRKEDLRTDNYKDLVEKFTQMEVITSECGITDGDMEKVNWWTQTVKRQKDSGLTTLIEVYEY